MGSEYGDDLWIMANIDLPSEGFYLDLGCAWPEQYSNTAFLRKRGWRGLCVDANPIYAPDWKGVEKFVCAVAGDGNPMWFEYNDAPDLSRESGNGILLPTIRLDYLLKGFPKVDVLSCDLEGNEFKALKTLGWDAQRPKVIISEHSTFGLPSPDTRVRELLLPFGYRIVHTNEANDIFLFE